MWQLIKTELKYYKWLYFLSILFVAIINLALTMDYRWIEAQNDFPGLRIIWIGISIVVFFSTLLFNRKSGRLRNNYLLPLSNKQIAISRIIPFVFFWILHVIILFLFYLININSLPTNDWVLSLVSLTGVILLINSIPVLNNDFYSTYFSKLSKNILGFAWAVFWISYSSLYSIFLIQNEFFEGTKKTLTLLFLSETTTILSMVLGALFYFGSIITFKKRKLFLE